MNKKIIFFLSFLLMVSFSAGVFIQFTATDQVSLSADGISFWGALWSGCKSDFTIAAAALLFAMSTYTVTLLLLLVTSQTFIMGFSAAWLLASHPQGVLIVCTVFLPRCLVKLPVYLALILLCFETAKSRRRQSRKSIIWQFYILCLALLLLSSLLEAALHLLIVSP